MITRDWVKLPVGWIDAGGLKELGWKNAGSANVAAVLVLIAVAHLADEKTGMAKVTYAELQDATSLSRTKISEGLRVLEAKQILTSEGARSTYLVQNYEAVPWGKLPAKGLYRDGVMTCFRHFTLRNISELRALKIFLLLVARRDYRTNLCNIGYDAISQATGIHRNNIKGALNILVLNNIIHVEKVMRDNGQGYYNAYRIAHVEPYRHMGTIGYSGGVSEVTM